MFLILCETLSLKMLKTHVRHVSKKESPSKATYIPMQAAKFCQSRVGMCSLCNWCHMSISMISVVCQKLWNVKKNSSIIVWFFLNSVIAENIEKRRLIVLFEILLTDSNVVICSINCAEFYKHSCFLPNVTIYHHYNFINQYFVLCFPCAIVFFIFM